MIRIRVPLRLALMAGLLSPGIAPAQDARPAGPADPVAAARSAYEAAAKVAAEAEAAAKVAQEQMLKAQSGRVEAFHQVVTGEVKAALTQGKANTAPQPFRNPTATRVYTPRQARTLNQATTVRFAATDPLDASFGLSLADADDALRAQLAIPAGLGVVVVSVKPDGLAGQAGLKSNDVVTALGEEPAKDVAQAKAKILAVGKNAIQLKLIREGKPSQLSLVGPGHGTPDPAPDYWIGVPVTPVDATLRSHVQGLPEGVGLVANDVVADSPAAKAGVKKFDILFELGQKPLKDTSGLIAAVQAAEGKPAPLMLYRAGESMKLQVTPIRREQPRVTNLVITPGDYQWAEALKQVNGVAPANGVATFDWARVQPLTFQAAAATEPARLEALVAELKGVVEDLKKQVEAINKPDGK